jgi:phosphoribosylanthranilate isomerase
MHNLIQIAGIIDAAEAQMMIDLGVDYLGFPLRLPVNKEDQTEAEAGELIKAIPAPHKGVLITYINNADEVIEMCDALRSKVMQLHGDIEVSELQKLKKLRPDIEIIKSLVVRGNNFEELETMVDSLSPYVDAFITDTFDPSTGAEGATGKTHDWNISAMLVELSEKPVILAGGLNADNVRQAIVEVCPAGVDVHTGVEGKDGRKDYELVKKFVEEAKAGFAEIESN